MAYVVDRILGEVDIESELDFEGDADTLGDTTWQHAIAGGAGAFTAC